MPGTSLKPSLHELADIVEQIFRIACTENLHPGVDDFETARRDYAAAHGISASRMHELSLNAMREIRERAQVIALMRFYVARWRVFDPEGRRHMGQQQKRLEKQKEKSLHRSDFFRKDLPQATAAAGRPADSNCHGAVIRSPKTSRLVYVLRTSRSKNVLCDVGISDQ